MPLLNSFSQFQGGSFVVVLCCLFFGVRVSVTFHLMCVHIIFRFCLLSGHLLVKKLLTKLTICYLCILTICNIS